MTEVAGVLLAAGTSSRMGRNKLLLRLGGESMLRRAARTAVAAGLDPLIVVVGHEAQRSRAELEGLDCAVVENRDYARGMNTSLAAGIAAVPEGPAAAMVLLADMPFVTAEMIGHVAARWQGEPLAASLYGEVLAPPILYARALFGELKAMQPDGSGKHVVEKYRARAVEVPQPPAALRDLDVPDDVEHAKAEIERS